MDDPSLVSLFSVVLLSLVLLAQSLAVVLLSRPLTRHTVFRGLTFTVVDGMTI